VAIVSVGRSLAIALLAIAACQDPIIETMDASDDAGVIVAPDAELPPDSGGEDAMVSDGGFSVRSLSLTPAARTATVAGRRLQGSLRATTGGRAVTSTHELRGGIVPQGP
jgi:hypothetical protein